MQAVEIRVPNGATVAVGESAGFVSGGNPLHAGLLVGHPYRLQVRDIPRTEGAEVYPSVELIDRLHPPAGQENNFPVTISLAQEDLEEALAGRLVVRVVYVEDPADAFPAAEDPQEQRYVDVLPEEDPLAVADLFGRPIAIVRLGSRVPDPGAWDPAFFFDSPPVAQLPPPSPAAVGEPHADIAASASENVRAAARYRDEYLCDGGDQLGRVRPGKEQENAPLGLDLEDTVGHFRTLGGQTVVTPSNRVCIYAPRMAAVRKLYRASIADRTLSQQQIEQPLPVLAARSQEPSVYLEQPVPLGRHTKIAGPRQLVDKETPWGLENVVHVREVAQILEAHEELQVVRLGVHASSERALMQSQVDAVLVWTNPESAEVLLAGRPAAVERGSQSAAQIYQLDTPDRPRLRVIKLASTPAARPGETVEFTIRYDNIGDQPIRGVTLIDNLTTRLEYVPDTAESDREAKFFTQPNEGVSTTLRWQLEETLPPGGGGVVRFKCRVR